MKRLARIAVVLMPVCAVLVTLACRDVPDDGSFCVGCGLPKERPYKYAETPTPAPSASATAGSKISPGATEAAPTHAATSAAVVADILAPELRLMAAVSSASGKAAPAATGTPNAGMDGNATAAADALQPNSETGLELTEEGPFGDTHSIDGPGQFVDVNSKVKFKISRPRLARALRGASGVVPPAVADMEATRAKYASLVADAVTAARAKDDYLGAMKLANQAISTRVRLGGKDFKQFAGQTIPTLATKLQDLLENEMVQVRSKPLTVKIEVNVQEPTAQQAVKTSLDNNGFAGTSTVIPGDWPAVIAALVSPPSPQTTKTSPTPKSGTPPHNALLPEFVGPKASPTPLGPFARLQSENSTGAVLAMSNCEFEKFRAKALSLPKPANQSERIVAENCYTLIDLVEMRNSASVKASDIAVDTMSPAGVAGVADLKTAGGRAASQDLYFQVSVYQDRKLVRKLMPYDLRLQRLVPYFDGKLAVVGIQNRNYSYEATDDNRYPYLLKPAINVSMRIGLRNDFAWVDDPCLENFLKCTAGFYNDQLNPSVGLSFMIPGFATTQAWELGVGPSIGIFNDLAFMGYAVDFPTSQHYYYWGVSLPAAFSVIQKTLGTSITSP